MQKVKRDKSQMEKSRNVYKSKRQKVKSQKSKEQKVKRAKSQKGEESNAKKSKRIKVKSKKSNAESQNR